MTTLVLQVRTGAAHQGQQREVRGVTEDRGRLEVAVGGGQLPVSSRPLLPCGRRARSSLSLFVGFILFCLFVVYIVYSFFPLWRSYKTGCIRQLRLLYQKYPRWSSLREINFVIILEAGSPRSRCQHGPVLVRVLLLACRWLPAHSAFTWWREEVSPLVSLL